MKLIIFLLPQNRTNAQQDRLIGMLLNFKIIIIIIIAIIIIIKELRQIEVLKHL